MSKLIEKINNRKLNEQKKTSGYIKTSSLRMKFKDGRNVVRFAGNYVEVHTHSLNPNTFGSIGVADEAFFKVKGADRLPFEVACTDWNLKTESYQKERTCPFCKLYKRASEALKRKDLGEDEKKIFENIKNACKPSKKLKWNLIDRDAPFYIKVQNGKEEEVRGYKFADMSFGMFNDIRGIVEQNNLDISDPDFGIDIVVTKNNTNNKTSYTIQPCIEGISVKVTPLTDEEKKWKLWDFVEMYDKSYDFAPIKAKMHEEFLAILEMSDEEFKDTISGGNESAVADDTPPEDAEIDEEDVKKNSLLD